MDRYHNNNKQPVRKEKIKAKRKKGGLLKTIFKILLVLFVLLAVFSLYQYQKGYRIARKDEEFGQVEEENFNGIASADGSINVLLLGSDSRGDDRGRSDSLMIAHYDRKEKIPQLVSFMRDAYVEIPGYGMNKINAAYAYGGPELVRQTIQHNFGINVEYYAVVNFGTFSKIIDTLSPKGLELNAEKTLDVEGTTIEVGEQVLSGAEALAYARFRNDEEGDFGRVRRQQQVLNALFDQGLSLGNADRLPEAIGKVQGYTTTNVPSRLYPLVALDFLTGRSKPLEKLVVPVEGSWQNSYYQHAGSVLEMDFDQNNQAIEQFLFK